MKFARFLGTPFFTEQQTPPTVTSVFNWNYMTKKIDYTLELQEQFSITLLN